jgi:hypothetical protein
MTQPWNAAWEEAEATAPPGVVTHYTIELQHPGFVQGDPPVAIPIRCVTGVADDMQFGIEAGATFNAGQMATFIAIPFHVEMPEFSEGKMPECQIVIDNAGREIIPHVEAAVEIKADLKLLYREYRSDSLTEPCYGPVEYVVRNVIVKDTTVTGTAKLDDLANRKFPFKIYASNEFPGLAA